MSCKSGGGESVNKESSNKSLNVTDSGGVVGVCCAPIPIPIPIPIPPPLSIPLASSDNVYEDCKVVFLG